ncbi:hypothetical protein HK100_011948 [Physocladia obscura]|uniref:HPt domain-containing protein n=1 Tax=Physocladia obscura TaxID=109957 RepID=A0AAD5TAY5_9FUNG|nr:hypothetical protein HK100_011948 [Physocladia obscura]
MRDNIIDMGIFEQLLEMDDDEERDFSKGIAVDFISQTEAKLNEMDASLSQKNLQSLATLGHFVKGSCAAFGFTELKETCEQIQNYGRKVDRSGLPLTLTVDECLAKLSELLADAQKQYFEAKAWLKEFYGM